MGPTMLMHTLKLHNKRIVGTNSGNFLTIHIDLIVLTCWLVLHFPVLSNTWNQLICLGQTLRTKKGFASSYCQNLRASSCSRVVFVPWGPCGGLFCMELYAESLFILFLSKSSLIHIMITTIKRFIRVMHINTLFIGASEAHTMWWIPH